MKINKIFIPAACSLIIAIALYPIFNPGIRRALTLGGFRKAAESMNIIAQEWENAGYDYMFTDRKMYETDTIAVGYRTDDTMPVGANKNHFRYILTEKKYHIHPCKTATVWRLLQTAPSRRMNLSHLAKR